MYVDTAHSSRNGKTYTRHLLRESYYEDGKVKTKTIANLGGCKPEELEAIKLALKHKGNLQNLLNINDIIIGEHKSIGAVYVLSQLAGRVGITKALGKDKNHHLKALWQIIARIINQGSRCSAARLLQSHEGRVVGVTELSEDQLYRNLDWLKKHQIEIEKRLLKQSKNNKQLYLYDVTSSYLEGEHNEYGDYGYNRDKKKGEKQIVIGLLTDDEGIPISIKVFKGNTQDPKTFTEQVRVLKAEFNVKGVTMVGDRGMIKSTQIGGLPEDYSYITAITEPQIQTLIKEQAVQLSFFSSEIAEVEYDSVRYIMRLNPVRREEIRAIRQSKIDKINKLINEQNQYLLEHRRASLEVAKKNVTDKIEQLKMTKIIELSAAGRQLEVKINQEQKDEIEKLDGCYCIKSNLDRKLQVRKLFTIAINL